MTPSPACVGCKFDLFAFSLQICEVLSAVSSHEMLAQFSPHAHSSSNVRIRSEGSLPICT